LVRTDLVDAKHVSASGDEGVAGLAATGGPNAPAVIGTGLPGQAGGLFVGSIGIQARTDGYANTPGSAVAVEASVLSEAEGLALRCKPSTNSQPLRGAILIEPSDEPSQPERGEIYIDAQSNRVRWWDGAAWVDISIDSEE